MDPSTGDIYAMASYPWFDPNDFSTCAADPEPCRNRAVTDTFEPGSVNKVITAAAALETGAGRRVRPVPRAVADAGRRVHDPRLARPPGGDDDARRHHHASPATSDPPWWPTEVGNDATWRRYMARFGYGEADRDRVPGRGRGLGALRLGRRDPRHRLLRAGRGGDAAADGRRLRHDRQRRTVGRSRGSSAAAKAPTERSTPAPPRADARQVVRPDTAQMLTRMLAEVVKDGTGVEAQIPGYQVAGKTGTVAEDRRIRLLRRPLHGLVRRLPAGRRPTSGDRGVDRRTADRLRGRGRGAAVLGDRPATRSSGWGSRPRPPRAAAALGLSGAMTRPGPRPGARVSSDPVVPSLPPVPVRFPTWWSRRAGRASRRRRALRRRGRVRFARGDARVPLLLRPRRDASTVTTSRPAPRMPARSRPRRGSAGSRRSSARRSSCPRCAAAMGPMSAAVFGHPAGGHDDGRRHGDEREDHDRPTCSRRCCEAAGVRPGVVGTTGARVDGPPDPAGAHHARGARPATAARPDGGRRASRPWRWRSPPTRWTSIRVGRRPVRRRRLHEPLPGPSRLPPVDGRVLRRKGAAVHARAGAARRS